MNFIVPIRESPKDTLAIARRWLDEFDHVVLATVVSTWGSSSVPVGGQLVVRPDDQFEGSVSGGCVEVEVITEAADVLTRDQPKLLEFGVTEDVAWRAGLPCGGAISIYLERLQLQRDASYLDRILAARGARMSLAVLTTLHRRAPPFRGSRADAHRDRLMSAFRREPAARSRRWPGFSACVHPSGSPCHLGATHVGQFLADLATRIGYDVVIIDPRTAFTSHERIGKTMALTNWPEKSLRALGLDTGTAVVTLTHAAALDDEALSAALHSDCLYIGALGSKKTHAKRLERLRTAGFCDSELARIHAPVGLAIGAKGPTEIAVSILAEIVKVARGAV